MNTNENLEKLVQKVASELIVMDPANQDQANEVASIFNDISEGIGDISELPDAIKKQAISVAKHAEGCLGDISEAKECNDIISEVADTVESLQSLIDQVCRGTEVSEIKFDLPENLQDDSQSDSTQPSDNAEPAVETQEVAEDASTESEASADEDLLVISEEDAPLVADFAAESLEHIEAAESGLLELETNSEDKEAINAIFRGFHTIKGMAGFLNLTQIGSLAHSAESLLDLARNDVIKLVGEKMDLVFNSLDMLKNMITDLQTAIETSSPVPSQDGLDAMLAKLKTAIESSDASESSEAQDAPADEAKAETSESKAEKADSQTTEPEAKADADQNQVAEAASQETVESADNKEAKQAASNQAAAMSQARKIVAADEKIKVSMSRLDKLVNMVGELVIAQSMVNQDSINDLPPDHDLCQKISHQGKIIRELQELSMMMRMVPIHGVFQKMARLVRDLSHKVNKQIKFETFGEETELDRIVVDQIADPLIHMVRNSVDHGIESEEERVAAGKDPVGTVQLRAFHQAGNVIIEIVDDGKGLDKDKILEKAVQKGLVSPNDDLSDQDIYKLVFNPGFSTADKITDVSGRGVGMDVVKKNIESLRGKIDITSTRGKGTTFTIRLPLTLAIIDGQVVRLGGETYIIPIVSIDSCLKPQKEQISTIRGKVEVAQVHGELLPIVHLHRLFNVNSDSEDPSEASLVVVEEDGKRGCLMVDEALGQQQVVIKSLGSYLGKIKGVAGGAILGDGRVSLILDVVGLLETAWG